MEADRARASIAESVVDAVVARTGDQRVTTVRLRIGRLAGVVRDAFEFSFELASAGTPLEGASLEIDEPEGRLHAAPAETRARGTT